MKKPAAAMLFTMLSFAATAYAQSPSSEITESTDPAKIADVEQRARDIQERQQARERDATSGSSDEAASAEKKPMKKKKTKAHKAKPADSTSGASSGAESSGASGGVKGDATIEKPAGK